MHDPAGDQREQSRQHQGPWGAIIGALFITILPHMLEGFEQFKLLVYGVMMTVVMIFMPDGLGKGIVDALSTALRRLRRK